MFLHIIPEDIAVRTISFYVSSNGTPIYFSSNDIVRQQTHKIRLYIHIYTYCLTIVFRIYFFYSVTSLYPSSRSSFIHQRFSSFIINFKRNQPVENMGKNIKSYATTQVHSPGEGREALRQIIQIFQLQM